jgi:SulP family sulfate permease
MNLSGRDPPSEMLRGTTRQFLWDLSGAFGDIGVLFPIAIALITKNGFNPTALLLMAGLFYVASAYYFRITMPVQPLKAMSAIAIATGLGFEVINAAGLVMGIILMLIALTGVGIALGKVFSLPVIRGIQLGLGMLLIKTSTNLMNGDIPVALMAGAILFMSVFFIKRIPPLLPLLILGIALAFRHAHPALTGPVALKPMLPDLHNLWTGFVLLVLPQIALTFGNAIVATEATAKTLYGTRAARLTLRSIPLSMAIANIVSGLMGGAPMCHGSGGVTAHFKFGATTNSSGYIIGITLIGLGLLCGGTVLGVLSSLPKGILGVLLCYVGIQHALFIKDILRDKAAMMLAATVAIVGVATNNLTIGFLAGIGIHYSLMGLRRAGIPRPL